MSMKKRLAIIAGLTVVFLTGAAVAFAVLGGTVTGITGAVGVATGSSSACQNQNVNFSWGGATWDNAAGQWNVTTLGYSNITNACVTANAVLNYAVENSSGITVASGNATTTATSGTITLATPIDAATLTDLSVNYYVVG